MTHRLPFLFVTSALVVIPSLRAAAQEYSNGGKGPAGRGPAILTPVEAFGVHPPGLAPADARHWKPYFPYYAPLSPVASSTRWKPWRYRPLWPFYTPYYMGYSPHRHSNPPPRPYGSNGWGKGPPPEIPLPEKPGTTPLEFGPYTSVVTDETTYWNLGGNGLVPYGEIQPTDERAPDLVDAIQASRPRGHVHVHLLRSGPAVIAPGEAEDDRQQGDDGGPNSPSDRRIKPAEPIPAGDVSEEAGNRPDYSNRRRAKRATVNRSDKRSS